MELKRKWSLMFSGPNAEYILILLFGALITSSVFGQQQQMSSNSSALLFRGILLHGDFNYRMFSVRDESTSPLTYSGMLPGLELGFESTGIKLKGGVDFSFAYGHLTTRNYSTDKNRAISYNGAIDMYLIRKIGSYANGFGKIYLGPGIQTITNFRVNNKYNNASLNYEMFSTVGIRMHIEHYIKLSKGVLTQPEGKKTKYAKMMRISAFVYFPLVSGVLRPDYAVIDNFVDNTARSVNPRNIRFCSLNRFWELNTGIGGNIQITNRSGIRFAYQFKFYDFYPVFNSVKGLSHEASVSYVFRISK